MARQQDRPKRAFELRADYDVKTFGGTVALGDGSTFDVAAELKKGGGKIVTANEQTATALAAYPALKEVPAASKSGGKGDS